MNLSDLTNEELTNQLQQEISYYNTDTGDMLYKISKIITKTIPKSMTIRLISKLYKTRKGE